MLAPVTPDLLRQVFTQDQIVRVPLMLQGEHIAHEPTRRYLAEVGLPESGCSLIRLRKDLRNGLTRLADHRDTTEIDSYEAAVPGIGEWVCLGISFHCDIALDGRTGKVYAISDDIERVSPVHTDLSSLAYGSYVLQRRNPDYDTSHGIPEIDDLIRVAEEVQAEVSGIDPLPFADGDGIWGSAVNDMSSGMW